MTDLREQLRDAIDRIGQREVARRAGVPQPSVSAWLSGTRNMLLERQIDVAKACGYEVEIRLSLQHDREKHAMRWVPCSDHPPKNKCVILWFLSDITNDHEWCVAAVSAKGTWYTMLDQTYTIEGQPICWCDVPRPGFVC